MAFPIGFRFEPTDEELMWGFLIPKVTGAPLPWDGIADRDVYGPYAEPWAVFSDADDASSPYWTTKIEGGAVKRTIYVFTRVSKASSDSIRHSRLAGCGTWSGQSGPKKICHSGTGAVIGFSRLLAFEKKKKKGSAAAERKEKEELGHWIMYEYCLEGDGLKAAGIKSTDIVLCKITKCVKNKKESASCRRSVPGPAVEVAEQSCLPEMLSLGHQRCDFPVEATAAAVEGDGMKRRGGEEILEEEDRFKKHKPSSLNNGGDIEGFVMGDFDFDFDFDIDIESLLDLPVEAAAVEGDSVKRRGGEELLDEEDHFKKHRSSSLDSGGDEGCFVMKDLDFDFDKIDLDSFLNFDSDCESDC